MILTGAAPTVHEFERGTGWAVKPEGACQGEICVPLPGGALGADGTVDVELVAERLGMPLVREGEVTSVGPAVLSQGKVLETAVAPDFELPTLDGDLFRLSSLRGQKVVLVAWAPY